MLPESEWSDTMKRLSQWKQRLGHSRFSSSLQGYISSFVGRKTRCARARDLSQALL